MMQPEEVERGSRRRRCQSSQEVFGLVLWTFAVIMILVAVHTGGQAVVGGLALALEGVLGVGIGRTITTIFTTLTVASGLGPLF